MAKEKPGNLVVIKNVRFSYVYVFTPKKNQQGKDEYSVRALIPKTDKESLSAIAAAVEFCKKDEALRKKWRFAGGVPQDLEKLLIDGDTKCNSAGKIPPENAGCYYLNLHNASAPTVIDMTQTPPVETKDANVFYSGCYGIASFTIVPYEHTGKHGFSTYLSNLAKTKEGERFGGVHRSAEEDFAEFLSGPNATAAQNATDELSGLM